MIASDWIFEFSHPVHDKITSGKALTSTKACLTIRPASEACFAPLLTVQENCISMRKKAVPLPYSVEETDFLTMGRLREKDDPFNAESENPMATSPES